MKKPDKIFVTGADGFIGYHLTRRLVKDGFEVTALIRSNKKLRELKKLKVNIVFGDITDKKLMADLLTNHNILVHLAAVKSSWLNRDEIMKINSFSIENFFSMKTSLKHIILTSSVYVFGRIFNSTANEKFPLKAHDLYGKSKVLAEDITKRLSKKYNIPYTIIRPAIVYGPGDSNLGMVYKMIKLVEKKIMPIIDDGRNSLHMIYIDDLVDGFVKVIQKGGYNQTYIMASGKTIQLAYLISLIKKELGIKYSNLHIPRAFLVLLSHIVENIYLLGKILKVKYLLSEPLLTHWKIITLSDNWRYDISKAKNDLRFEPRVSYEVGIKKTISWYLKMNEVRKKYD